MRNQSLVAVALAACLTATGAPLASAAPAGSSLLTPGESAGNNVVEIGDYGPRIDLPIGPGSVYYDYPYYYSRGYYPTHIGPGYAYYGPYGYAGDYYPTYRDWDDGDEDGCAGGDDCE